MTQPGGNPNLTQITAEIHIAAPRRAVWEAMLGENTYRQWTAAFMEGSYYEGSWEEGASIRFLAPNGDGMASVIAEHRPEEFVSIRHTGFILNGVTDEMSEAVKKFVPAYENYTFTDEDGGTRVHVSMEIDHAHADMMRDLWPKALDALKRLCEG